MAQPNLTPGEPNGPLIPLEIDDSGSSRAHKRKQNREAATRFRRRKKQLQETLEALERKEREIQTLRQQQDFYHSERNFLRQWITETFPSAQLPTRPVSPRLRVDFMLD
jgi:predicted O-linked N-acetylglucosamine transferase (SPINDLY family)